MLVLAVFTACSKKTQEGATTTTAAAADGKEATVEYKAENVKAKLTLPEFGDIEMETEDVEGEGATYIKVYTANPDKQAYADVEMHLTIATEDLKQKNLPVREKARMPRLKSRPLTATNAAIINSRMTAKEV